MLAFRDNIFANPEGLIAYIREQGAGVRMRPDPKDAKAQQLVFYDDWEKPVDRLKGTAAILRKLASIAEQGSSSRVHALQSTLPLMIHRYFFTPRCSPSVPTQGGPCFDWQWHCQPRGPVPFGGGQAHVHGYGPLPEGDVHTQGVSSIPFGARKPDGSMIMTGLLPGKR